MCGIIGGLSRYPNQVKDINPFLQMLHHRGPDDRGTWSDSHIHIGHTRLSILDLSHMGHQPMSYNERFWITFNGEIYNYLELRKELKQSGYKFISQTDTEVLLAAYAQWGISCLKKLRGMFAFGIWDKKTETLFLARDRCGEKPLYYYKDDSTFYFASELKTLTALLPNIPELDPVAVDLYFHYQYIPEPKTPLKDVYKLPASHYMLIDCKNWRTEMKGYWNLLEIEPVTGNPAELIREELEKVITLTLRSDVPVGVALSGGLDSGGIAALASRKYKDTLQAFSVGYPNHPPYDERNHAKKLAQHIGLPFYEIELRTEEIVNFFPELVAITDDPIADIAAYGHYSVTKLAADQGVKVILTGIGGDELFWGYSWVRKAVQLTEYKLKLLSIVSSQQIRDEVHRIIHHPYYYRISRSSKIPKFFRSLLNKAFDLDQLNIRFSNQAIFYDLVPDFKDALNYTNKLYTKSFASCIPSRNPYHIFEINPDKRSFISVYICQLLFDTWLVSNCLSLGDRVSMACSVETRLPLLDYKLIELVIGLRKSYPDYSEHKLWLKLSLKNILNNEILERPKRGFEPPTKEWIEPIIRKYIDWLLDGYLISLKIIDKDYLTQITEEFFNYGYHYFMLYKMLVLETWYRKVVIRES